MDTSLALTNLRPSTTPCYALEKLESRVYAWIRATGIYEPGGWARTAIHVRIAGILEALGVEYTLKGRALYFTLLDNEKEPYTFWSVDPKSFLEEFFVIKNLTACKSSIQLKNADDELAFMLLTSVEGYRYQGKNAHITKVYKA